MKFAQFDTVYVSRGRWPDAACHGQVKTMTVVQGRLTNLGIARINRAKKLCASCPVLAECRKWAMSDPDPVVSMVAGGMTPRERELKRAGSPAAPT